MAVLGGVDPVIQYGESYSRGIMITNFLPFLAVVLMLDYGGINSTTANELFTATTERRGQLGGGLLAC